MTRVPDFTTVDFADPGRAALEAPADVWLTPEAFR